MKNAPGVNGKPFRTRTICGVALLALGSSLLSICLAAATTFSDANWSSMNLSTGSSSGPIGAVAALAVSGDEVYAGGDFTVGGVSKWNGTNWSTLASGIELPVFALAVSGTDVYAGGAFSRVGSVAAANIAKWNGSNWSALGLGVYGINTDEGGPIVFSLAVSGTDLYVGGSFAAAGEIAAANIAKWDGSNWSALGPGLQELGCCGNGFGVFALATSGNDLYAGGYFLVSTADGIALANVAKWDGTNWSALAWGPVHRHAVKALAVSGNELYASDGYGMVAKWNGTSWSTLGSGMNSPVSALAVSGSDLYAGGSFTTAGDIQANSIAKWNGSSWTALGSGVNGKVQALTVSGSDLYVGGYFTTAGGKVSAYIARAFLLDLPATITVTNTADSGTGTLREALASAAEGDTINFSLPIPATITLTSGELLVSNSVTILGPGANELAVDGNSSNRVFHLTPDIVVCIIGLTITNGWERWFAGGGILNDHATLSLSNCTLSGNFAGRRAGGAILNDHGSLTVANSALRGNFARSGGAIASAAGTLLVENSILSGNMAAVGGAMSSTGDNLWLVNSTLNNNVAEGVGGIFSDGGSLFVANSTISGNIGNNAGGIETFDGLVQIANSTFSGNSYYGIGFGGTGRVEIGSTILNAAVAPWDSFSNIKKYFGTVTVTSLGYNLCSDTGAGVLTNRTDLINTNPRLGPLQDNGGPTFTQTPLPGSPAIDSGRSFSTRPGDQRGFSRTVDHVITNAFGGDGTDIGAVEIAATPFLFNFGIISGEAGFKVGGISNQVVIVEVSTNVANWTPLATNTLGPGPLQFADPLSANLPKRFYRVRQP